MCGEHVVRITQIRGNGGSSPHVRGTRVAVLRHIASGRFIPACAGNTAAQIALNTQASVHPRMCGEHVPAHLPPPVQIGSSPHVRGTRPDQPRRGSHRRFIPACAGNTWGGGPAVEVISVHPRMCGEHVIHRNKSPTTIGSSPHVRGTLPGLRFGVRKYRFIPACAGNTLVPTLLASY